jgi:hypothetical protein
MVQLRGLGRSFKGGLGLVLLERFEGRTEIVVLDGLEGFLDTIGIRCVEVDPDEGLLHGDQQSAEDEDHPEYSVHEGVKVDFNKGVFVSFV